MHTRTGVDVVVVGGGILGTSAALHLRRAGLAVLLLDSGRVGAGTSAAAGGFINMWAAGAMPDWAGAELECERYAFEFYNRLAAEGKLVLHRNGGLWIAVTEDGWNAHLAPIADHPAVTERVILEPHEIERVTCGLVSAAGVVGGVLHPSAFHLSTSKAVRAVAAQCVDEGVEIREGVAVRAVLTHRCRAQGVVTDEGPVFAGSVVVAAGAWSAPLLRAAGYAVPMVPLVATRLISAPLDIPEASPMLMVEELSFIWARGDDRRLLWGCEYDVRPRYDFVDALPPNRPSDIDGADAVAETIRVGRSAASAIPVLAHAQPVEVAHGLPCYTADLRALVGPVPGADGLFLVSGDNQAGMTHGPGYARLLAQLVTGGDAGAADAFRLDRFDPEANIDIAGEATRRLTALSVAESSASMKGTAP